MGQQTEDTDGGNPRREFFVYAKDNFLSMRKPQQLKRMKSLT